MVMVVGVGTMGDGAGWGVAMLAGGLQLQGGVGDAVFGQFLPDGVLDGVGVGIGDDVHSGIVMVAVQASEVDMVGILHTV